MHTSCTLDLSNPIYPSTTTTTSSYSQTHTTYTHTTNIYTHTLSLLRRLQLDYYGSESGKGRNSVGTLDADLGAYKGMGAWKEGCVIC